MCWCSTNAYRIPYGSTAVKRSIIFQFHKFTRTMFSFHRRDLGVTPVYKMAPRAGASDQWRAGTGPPTARGAVDGGGGGVPDTGTNRSVSIARRRNRRRCYSSRIITAVAAFFFFSRIIVNFFFFHAEIFSKSPTLCESSDITMFYIGHRSARWFKTLFYK